MDEPVDFSHIFSNRGFKLKIFSSTLIFERHFIRTWMCGF